MIGMGLLCFQNPSHKMICTLQQSNVLDGSNPVAVPLNIKRIHQDFVKKKKYYSVFLKVNSLHFPSFNPIGPVLVYGQFECKFNSLRPSDAMNFDNIGSCNGLLPDCTKPLLDPKLTNLLARWALNAPPVTGCSSTQRMV